MLAFEVWDVWEETGCTLATSKTKLTCPSWPT